MLIYESREETTIERLKEIHKRIANALPRFDFPDYINFTQGVIHGCRYQGGWPDSYAHAVAAYYHHNIAVVNAELKDKEEVIKALQDIGYFVPEEQMHFPTCEKSKPAINILWEELRKGRGKEDIKRNLTALLSPILSATPDVKEYEFAVYSPCVIESTDDVCVPYIEYDEIFHLPVTKEGVDVLSLVEKIKVIPEGRALAISSRVKTPQGTLHMPMIDFMSREVDEESVKLALSRLEHSTGFLVLSGNSYHYYNPRTLMREDEFIDYLNLIAEQPEISSDHGKSWPWLQAHQGFSLLRITPCQNKPFYPEIVKNNQ